MTQLPASAIIPTRNRHGILAVTIESLLDQGHLPAELIVVDASDGEETRLNVEAFAAKSGSACEIKWLRATSTGAATQRNQGIALATQPFVFFFDDDIRFECDCVKRLWSALCSNPHLGGVNAMIINQRYHTPGSISRLMFRLMAGESCTTYAGRVLGPAVNLLPEDRDDLPEVVETEWLNTTCTVYRREALPQPPFPTHFTGYSLMEDVTLSLIVGRRWKLANARTARIYHDSQPGTHKQSIMELSRMQLVNRYYVMTSVLQRTSLGDHVKLLLWEIFGIASTASSAHRLGTLPQSVLGKLSAIPGMFNILTKSP